MGREDLRSDGVLVPPVDWVLAGVAGRQEGMVSHAQLRAAGFGRGAIELRLRNGRLHPYCRGVYLVGHTRLTARARLWAAVLACGGPGAALLGFRGAAAPWELMPEQDRARDARLTALGYRVIRITWRQLTERPHEVANLLRQLLR